MTEPLRLRVVTLNMHGGRPAVGPPDLGAVAQVIRELHPDVVALQEVHRFLPPPGVFADQPRRLAALSGMEALFEKSFGMGKWGYGNALLLRGSAARSRRRRLPSGKEPRTALEAELLVGGKAVRLWNTHWGLDPAERLRQAEALAAMIRKETGPVLLAGDLNAAPDSAEVRLLENAGLKHCVPVELPSFPSEQPVFRIDYLMASPHFRVENAFPVPGNVSDHQALAADLVLE